MLATISMVVLIGYQTYDVARADYGMGIARRGASCSACSALAQFVPLFLLTPVAGIAADRFDRRRVVLFANVHRLRASRWRWPARPGPMR